MKDLKDLFGKNLLNIESIFLDKTYENTFKDIKQRIGKNILIFVVILQSFSIFQHNKKYRNIDKLLSIKLYIYKSSYIVFVYNKLDNENAFKNEIEKFTRKNQKKKGRR